MGPHRLKQSSIPRMMTDSCSCLLDVINMFLSIAVWDDRSRINGMSSTQTPSAVSYLILLAHPLTRLVTQIIPK